MEWEVLRREDGDVPGWADWVTPVAVVFCSTTRVRTVGGRREGGGG